MLFSLAVRVFIYMVFLFSAIFMLRNKRSAFIQFEEEEEAQECLNAGSTAQIGDVDAIVKPAKQGAPDSNNRPKSAQKKG